jgi:uroporphyrin-III C-methyltransferase
MAHPHALVSSVGKRCARPRITQDGIHRLMIEAARAGQSVVRLKSGDPLVFGRAGEETRALCAAGILCEIVPGVTAALAAAASLSVPLTDRLLASKLIFCAGQHAADKEPSPLWSGRLPDDATLVIYMPGRDTARLARELANAGLPPDTPCCAVSHAATPLQSHAVCTLESLAGLECGPAPLLVIAGRAVAPLLEGEDLSLAHAKPETAVALSF